MEETEVTPETPLEPHSEEPIEELPADSPVADPVIDDMLGANEQLPSFSYMIYDAEGMPADAYTMIIDMISLNGEYLADISILLKIVIVLLLFKIFVRRRR